MESKAAKNYRLWKKEPLANQTGHHKNSHHNKMENNLELIVTKKMEEVVMSEKKEKDRNQYVVELAEGWR